MRMCVREKGEKWRPLASLRGAAMAIANGEEKEEEGDPNRCGSHGRERKGKEAGRGLGHAERAGKMG